MGRSDRTKTTTTTMTTAREWRYRKVGQKTEVLRWMLFGLLFLFRRERHTGTCGKRRREIDYVILSLSSQSARKWCQTEGEVIRLTDRCRTGRDWRWNNETSFKCDLLFFKEGFKSWKTCRSPSNTFEFEINCQNWGKREPPRVQEKRASNCNESIFFTISSAHLEAVQQTPPTAGNSREIGSLFTCNHWPNQGVIN